MIRINLSNNRDATPKQPVINWILMRLLHIGLAVVVILLAAGMTAAAYMVYNNPAVLAYLAIAIAFALALVLFHRIRTRRSRRSMTGPEALTKLLGKVVDEEVAEERTSRHTASLLAILAGLRAFFTRNPESPEVVRERSDGKVEQITASGKVSTRKIVVRGRVRVNLVRAIQRFFVRIFQQFRKWRQERREFKLLARETRANRIQRVYYPLVRNACRDLWAWLGHTLHTFWHFIWIPGRVRGWWQRRQVRKVAQQQLDELENTEAETEETAGYGRRRLRLISGPSLLWIFLPIITMVVGITMHWNWLWPLCFWAAIWLSIWSLTGWRMKTINRFVVVTWAILTITFFTR